MLFYAWFCSNGRGLNRTDTKQNQSPLRPAEETNFDVRWAGIGVVDAADGRGEGPVSRTGLSEAALATLPLLDDTTFHPSEIQPGFIFSLAAQLDPRGITAAADRLPRELFD